jgi:hypothetical protein
MMDATFKVLKNGLLGDLFIFLCIAYGFIFISVLILFVLFKSGHSMEQWGRQIQSCVKPMFLFGCKFFLSGFFGIYIIGPWLNAWLPSAEDNICGLIGIAIVVFIWLLYQWFRIVRIITVVAMGAVLIGIFGQGYLPSFERFSSDERIRSNEVLKMITAEAQHTSQSSGTVRIFPGSRTFEEISQNNKTVKVDPQYKICPLYDQTKAVKSGATIPIELELCNASGADVSAANIVVTATALTQISRNSPGMLEDAGNANPDNNFRYDAALGRTGGYIFNLKTTGLSTGTYSLSFTTGSDPTVYSVQFQVK